MSSLGKWAFKIALNPNIGGLVGYGFEYASFLLPVKKVKLNPKTIAFYHPRPAWEKHILIVPRKKIRNIFKLCQQPQHFQDVLNTAAQLIQTQFKPNAYTLLVNGGIRQDVLQVHFHLNSEKAFVLPVIEMPQTPQLKLPDFDFYVLQNDQHFHGLYIAKNILPLSKWENLSLNFDLGLESLNQTFNLTTKGFSLVFQESSLSEQKHLVIHLVAGGKLETKI